MQSGDGGMSMIYYCLITRGSLSMQTHAVVVAKLRKD